MVTTKKCKQGKPCGNSCQARNRQCSSKAGKDANTIIDNFALMLKESQMLTKGYFGEVYKTPQGTLIKKAFADAPPERQIQQSELDVQAVMSAAGFSPKLLGKGIDTEGNTIIEMEYLDGYRPSSISGSAYHDGSLTSNQGKQIASALDYMHRQGYAHDDIHALNIMVNDSNDDAKLIDFGKSFKIDANVPAHRRAVYRDLVKAASTLKLSFEPESAQAQALAGLAEAKGLKKGKAQDAAIDSVIEKYLSWLEQ